MTNSHIKIPESFTSIIMSDNAIDESIRHLDLYSRLLTGQYDRIPEMMGCSVCSASDYPILRDVLLKIRCIFIPDLNHYGIYTSNGIWSPKAQNEQSRLMTSSKRFVSECLGTMQNQTIPLILSI